MIHWLEQKLVYPRLSAKDSWEPAPSPEIQEGFVPTETGEQIHYWFLPVPDSRYTFLICHGNFGNLSHRGNKLLRFRQWFNCSVAIFDYPGYGKSSGRPSEAGCYSSAKAMMNWLKQHHLSSWDQLFLYGESLGGGVAVEMACQHPLGGLALIKTFSSLPAAAKYRFRLLPAYWLMRNRFDNLNKMARVQCPIFIASASLDSIVPFGHGEELYRNTTTEKYFLPLTGQDHNDPLPDDCFIAIQSFFFRRDDQPS